MGCHTGGSGRNLGGGTLGKPEQRQGIYDYCMLHLQSMIRYYGLTCLVGPEVKMTLEMDARQLMPGECNQNW